MINKKHKDYPEYIEKCKAISKKYFATEDAIREQYKDWNGRDHPATGELIANSRKYNTELRELQKQYSYLFFEEEEKV